MLLKFFKSKSKSSQPQPVTGQELIRREAKVGSNIFGIVPPDRRREFFNLDSSTWIWYEEWTDQKGRRHAVTTRYELRGSVILKIQGDAHPEKLTGEELRNFSEAVRNYYYRVAAEVYNRPVQA